MRQFYYEEKSTQKFTPSDFKGDLSKNSWEFVIYVKEKIVLWVVKVYMKYANV